jgi:hypothetical protein
MNPKTRLLMLAPFLMLGGERFPGIPREQEGESHRRPMHPLPAPPSFDPDAFKAADRIRRINREDQEMRERNRIVEAKRAAKLARKAERVKE